MRVVLADPQIPDAKIENLPTFGGSGLLPGVDLDDRRALIDLINEVVRTDALR